MQQARCPAFSDAGHDARAARHDARDTNTTAGLVFRGLELEKLEDGRSSTPQGHTEVDRVK